ncbi:MAG TPA: DUF3375 family protein [Chthoniobacteraceae bacterium]|nr:DUF3375 family protein [Chthoniobacteraceae bacterium]
MKSSKLTAAYRRLRTQALWKLLASDNGPTILALLQSHLYESERSLPGSIFHDHIARELEELRANGETLPQTAQGYIAGWLAAG